MPLLTLSYKYFLPWHSFSTFPSRILKPISLAAALLKSPQTPAKSSPTVPQVSDLLLLREEMVVNFIVPEVNLFPSLPYLLLLANPFTQHFLSFFFSILPIFKLLGFE